MKNIPHRNLMTSSLKQTVLSAFLLALPLAALAQLPVFTDNFVNGSTTNKLSVPGGTPSASFTSYDFASSKNTTTGPTNSAHLLRLALSGGTTSGFLEIQALFAKSPISLNAVGDYLTMTYTFTNTTGTLLAGGNGSYIFNGLYNSAGVPPVAGLLGNGALSTATGSPFATNNAANWQGYVGRVSNGNTSAIYTRPVQNGAGTASSDQDLVGNNSGSGAYVNPSGTTVGATQVVPVPLTSNATYTISFTIALTDVQTLTITNALYEGPNTGGTLDFSQTSVATGATYLTNSFDGLAIGLFNKGANLNPLMDISSIVITANIFGTPGPSFGVTGGGTGCPGNSFPIGLTGSVATNDYRIFTNGVFNGVVVSGTGSALTFPAETVAQVALTNTVEASNTVSGFTGFMSGQAIVTPFGAPVITSQPVPLVVVNNGLGYFTVTSSGSGLGYQWFRNGTKLTDGGNISGSTSATLVISPATAADVANTAQGYYVIVTNGCGTAALSVTNSLTLGAPANITWEGGNPDNTWDVATTANFTNGAAPVVFHNGDNVTLDDTSIFPVINISGSLVAPSLITENAGQNYAITGSGSIAGPGALVMNGFGTLILSNANTFTGGTTISNGIVVERNGGLNSFGSGPINLAGGRLEIPASGSSALGLSNTLNTVTDSALQYDANGTFAFVFSGQLTGNPTATLTIFNNNGNTGISRMRMYGAFTNNANIFLSSGGAELEMAPYLGSNSQYFNGTISGLGRFVPRGGGSVVFNNTNTFNDNPGVSPYSLFMSSGNAGFGADSVSTTPGVLDASPAGIGKIGINVGTEGGTCSLFSSGGAHTVANTLAYTSTTNTVTLVLGGENNLTFSGEFDLADPLLGDAVGTNRTLQVTNTAATIFSGLITDNGVASGITKTGNGALYLNGADTYTGPTTVSGGVLAGTGSIVSPVVVQTNGLIGGGSPTAIGTLTINNSLTFDSGGALIRVNKTLSPAASNDVVSVTGALTANAGNGTIVVTNAGPAINVGDTFKIFNQAITGAGTFNIVGGGMNWNNNLAVDGSITAASVSTAATTPTNITFSVSGTNMTFSWPLDHLGWYLQMNTNLTSNTWRTLFGTQNHTNTTVPINPGAPIEFFRMSLQP
jgi:fibronectin-binding autotransporter adhesin